MLNTASKFVLIAALATPGAALAQTSETGSQLEEIVVTAQRREERLQDVPISVSAVTGASMERAGITDTRKLTQMMPGLVFSRTNSSFQPYIRGVGNRSGSIGDESNVSVYIDGVYQPMMSSLGFDLMNVQRIEVLRGPQGTLFGRNATGGLIHIITSDPTPEFSGKIQARAGNFGEYVAQVYLTGQITDGLLADVSYLRSTDSGFIKDLIRGGRVGDRDAEAMRAKLLFEPTDYFRASLTASYSYILDQSPVSNQPLKGNTVANTFTPTPLYGRRPWESANEKVLDTEGFGRSVDLQTRTKFSGFNLETTSSFQAGKAVDDTDNDASGRAVLGAVTRKRLAYLSNEVRLVSTGEGPFNWIAGGYLFNGEGEFIPLISVSAGAPGASSFTKQTVDSWAVFGEASYNLGDSIKLTGGLRYTDEERDYRANQSPAPAAFPTGAIVPLQKGADSQLTYRASVQYIFSPDANVYFSYSRGFKSGVFNGFATTLGAARITKPEILDSFEIGLKADPLPWLRTNFSVFHYDYKDIQQSARDPGSSLIILFNAARSTMNGGEVEVTLKPSDDLNLRFFATYLDAQYKSFPTAQVFRPRTSTSTLPFSAPCPIAGQSPCGNVAVAPYDASGNDMIRAPKYSFGFNFDYSILTGLGVFGVGGSAFYSAKYYWDFENRIAQPSYVQLSGEVSFALSDDDHAARFSIWGRNLANEAVYAQVLTAAQGDVVSYERPRSYGVAVSKKF